jgi:hypothetical protein
MYHSLMQRRDILKVAAAAPVVLTAQSVWNPSVFSAQQNELLVVLSELIMPATDTPGAKAAHVNRYIDLFLSQGPSEERQRFVAGLELVNGYAQKERQIPFVKLSADQQNAILERMDKADENDEGNRFFRDLKREVVRVYYQTEIGFKELNKKNPKPTLQCIEPSQKA